jgi:hypothetical protein
MRNGQKVKSLKKIISEVAQFRADLLVRKIDEKRLADVLAKLRSLADGCRASTRNV